MAEKKKAASGTGKGGRRALIVMLVASLLVLGGGGGAAAYLLGLFGGSRAAGDQAGTERRGEDREIATSTDDEGGSHGDGGSGHGDAAGPAGDGVAGRAAFVDLPDLLVNLQPDGKRMRFLRLRLALEVEGEKAATSVKTLTPRVLDSFQMYLRALTVEDVQGSAGMQRLKEEMIARVNLAIEPGRIRDVLFKEILVQ